MPTSLQQAYSSSSGYKNRVQFTADGTFTVPAGVYVLKEIWGTGGGGAGGGGSSSAAQGAGGGSSASTVIAKDVAVRPGDIITVKVGIKGLGIAGATGQNGGDTVVYRNFMPILKAKGGIGGATASASGMGGVNTVTTVTQLNAHGAAINATSLMVGGDAGDGANSLTAVSGKIIKVFPANTGTVDQMFPSFPITVSNGGVGTGSLYGGGGGGCSAYGVGGNGANAPTSSSLAVQGGDAVNRGAGGGGASGGSSSLSIRGGHGQDGIVEIYY